MAYLGALSVTKKKKSLTIGWTDCGVEEFGGGDYECYYTIYGKDVKVFEKALRAKYEGSLLEQCVQAFGENGSSNAVEAFFEENGIAYDRQVWS